MDDQTYRDPSRLFTIELPEGFEREESAKSLVFRHADIDGAVTVSCLRHRTKDADVNVFDALPSRDTMENITKSERDGIEVVYGDYTGELQNEPEAWRWWTLQRSGVGIVVSFNGSPEAATVGREKINNFVDGIRIPEKPPVSVEDFTQIAADVYAKALSKPKPAISRPLELDTGDKTVLRLENAYISYLDQIDKRPDAAPADLLTEWFEHLWGETNKELGPFEEVRSLIYPIVKGWGFARDTKIPVLRRTLLESEIELLAAVDTGRTLRFVSTEDVEKWEGVSEDDVFFYARENLLAMAKDLELQAVADEQGNPRMVIIATGDSYDASRLVLPELYARLSEVLGKNLLVGIPNRDFMVILTADDNELVSNVAAQVKLDSENRAYAISGKLYKFTAEGIESR